MKHGIYGHWWGWRTEMGPALLESFHVTQGPKDWYRRWKFREWVIDYAFDSAERYRMVAATRPWQVRQTRTLHLYPPGTLFWESSPGGRVHRQVYSKFLGGEAVGLNALVHPDARYARFLDPDGIAGPLLDEIARIGHQYGDRGFARAQSVFWMLIARMKESVPVEGETRRIENPAPAPAPSPLVQAINAYLEKNVTEPFTLASLARELHCSVSLLSHRYREEAGTTAKMHLMQLRMDRVKKMLIAGHPLKTAAAAAGFSDPYYLSRAFKREEGLSPRAYLENIRNGSVKAAS